MTPIGANDSQPTLRTRPSVRCLKRAAVLLLAVAFPGGVSSHGAHAVFLSPAHGEAVSEVLRVHVADPGIPIPYLRVEVVRRPQARVASSLARDPLLAADDVRGEPVWTGLLARESQGFAASIDVTSWSAGDYRVEVQFVGDIVEDVYVQTFVVGSVRSRKDTGLIKLNMEVQ